MFDNVKPPRHHRRPFSSANFDDDLSAGGRSTGELLSDSPVDQLLKLHNANMRPLVVDSSLPNNKPKQHTHITLIEEKLLNRKRKRKRKQHRRRHREKHGHQEHTSKAKRASALALAALNVGSDHLVPKHHIRHNKRNNLHTTNNDPSQHRERHRWLHHSRDMCSHALVDRCSWPQCNRSCPRLHNPFTGERWPS